MYTIVLFNSDLSGGAGKFITTLASALYSLHTEVHIVIYADNVDCTIPEGIHFHLLKQNGKCIGQKKNIVEALQKKTDEIGKIDFIMSNSSPANAILSMLDLPRIYHCIHSAETKVHHGPLAFLKRIWRQHKYKKLYSKKDLITVSKDLEAYILNTVKAKPRSIETIYNPFNFEEIRRLAEEEIPEIPQEPYLLHVGRFDMVSKRQDILLQAYKKADVPYTLVLIGEGEDKEKIKTLIEALGLQSKVVLHGYSANPYAWMKRAKLFVFSSDFEGFGRVLAEALIVGTPVVSTDCPTGPREILTGVLREFLVPIGDVEMLALKINQVLKAYPSMKNIDMAWLSDAVIAKQYIRLIHTLSMDADDNPKKRETS